MYPFLEMNTLTQRGFIFVIGGSKNDACILLFKQLDKLELVNQTMSSMCHLNGGHQSTF